MNIQTDPNRCIACCNCAKACLEQRTEVIELDQQQENSVICSISVDEKHNV